jgi:nucleoside-diphosphate-sugar epimerase
LRQPSGALYHEFWKFFFVNMVLAQGGRMGNVLVTGAVGQIGSELTTALRKQHGNHHVIAAGHQKKPSQDFLAAGPFETIDCTDIQSMATIVKNYKIDTIYHLAAILSAGAEKNPQLSWHVNIDGLYNVLEIAREYHCAVFTPSSIAAFGLDTPLDNTPQVTIQRPTTIYGIAKITGELLCNYYFERYGVDTRGLRYPGIISHKTEPGGGTTDYAVHIFFDAVRHKKYQCYLYKDTFLDMMYIPDAVKAAMDIMAADSSKLKHRNAYNITAMSISPETIANAIKRHIPEFKITYKIDPLRKKIADSWPNRMDDHHARQDWGWQPTYNLSTMTKDMLRHITQGEKSCQ